MIINSIGIHPTIFSAIYWWTWQKAQSAIMGFRTVRPNGWPLGAENMSTGVTWPGECHRIGVIGRLKQSLWLNEDRAREFIMTYKKFP